MLNGPNHLASFVKGVGAGTVRVCRNNYRNTVTTIKSSVRWYDMCCTTFIAGSETLNCITLFMFSCFLSCHSEFFAIISLHYANKSYVNSVSGSRGSSVGIVSDYGLDDRAMIY
jgi:hypothetical protein